MNARLRRMTTSGMLVLAALSFGCGADSPQSVLNVLPGPVGALPESAAESTAFVTTHAASVVGGSAGDVETANMTADALLSILRGGALQAASPTGGAISDSSNASMQFAALPAGAGTPPPVSSDAQLPRAAVHSLKRLLVLALGPTFAFEGDTLRVSATDGTQLTLSGVSPLPAGEAQAGEALQKGFTMSSSVHITGTVFFDGRARQVDLRITGLTGTIVFRDDHVYPDLTIGDNGIGLAGTAADLAATIAITGTKGHFTSVEDMNLLLAQKQLTVQITGARGAGFITGGSARFTIANLQLPITGGHPSGRVFGTGDLAFDPTLGFSQNGRVAHAGFEISSDRALVFDANGDLPRSGRIVATIHYASGSATDTLVISFDNGEVSFEGQLTNISGNPETVSTQGDATTATGSVAFVDGRTTDHKIEVRRRTGGRRNIVFTVAIKNAQGMQVLNLVGAVRSDKGVAGTWARSQFAGSTPGSNLSTGVRAALPTGTAVPQLHVVGFERAGAFRVNANGVLELVSEAGDVLARGPMPTNWNQGL